MKKTFIQGIKLINKLKYHQKCGTIIFLLFILIYFLFFNVFFDANKKIISSKNTEFKIVYLNETEEILHNIKAVNNLINQKINLIKENTILLIISAASFLVLLAYILVCFSFSVINGVKYLQNKALRVKNGASNIKSELETEDELKELSTSFNKMIYSLKNLIKREKITRNIIINALESPDIKETLSTIVINTAKLFDADRCFFLEYDSEKNVYLPIQKHNSYISSLKIKDVAGMQLSMEEMKPLTDFLFNKKSVFAVENINKLEMPENFIEIIKKCNIKSFIAAPLFYASAPQGFLVVESIKKQRKYREEDIKLMESISYQASIVIHQAKLMSQVKQKTTELESMLKNEKTLRKITTESSLLKTHEEVDNYILNKLMNVFNVSKIVHLHVDKSSLRWYGRKIKDEETEILEGQCFVPAGSADELIPEPEQVLIINDADEEIRNEHLKSCLKMEKIKALLAYPTSKKFAGREDKGVIEVTIISDVKSRTWTEEEKNLFAVIMDTLSIVTLETIQRRELEEVRKIFVSTLTHDLRSPILAEQKTLEFLLSPKAKKIDISEYLEDIYKMNDDLLKLINNLLSTYHYESGTWKLSKTPENIENLIKNVIKILIPFADERHAKIIPEITETIPVVDMDIIEIKRVLMNLITNALKHNDEGVKVIVGAEKKDDFIKIFVKDDGNGIPEEHQSKIFQRYFTQKQKIGAGLGLYISKQIVEAHKGKIWFETKEGKGSTFYFTLPL